MALLEQWNSTATLSISRELNPVIPMKSSRYKYTETIKITQQEEKPLYYEQGTHIKGSRDKKIHGLCDLPSNWQQFIHPDGKLYFRNTSWNTVTEVDVRNENKLAQLEAWHKRIINVDANAKAKLSINPELYLALDPKPGYYFVDHETQQVFWLEDLLLVEILPDHRNRACVELSILQNYYRHLEHFPSHNKLPPGSVDFLRGTLIYACTDHMTSGENATAPWSVEECKTFLELLEKSEDAKTSMDDKYKVWFIARLICAIIESQLLYSYGTYEASTDRHPASTSPLSSIDILTAAFSFCAHFSYLGRLEKVWSQGIVSTTGWRSLVAILLIEWADSNLLATVMLSANMAFLALGGVGPVEKTSSVVSAFFAIGSLAIGLHHVWRHRVRKDSDATQASIYIQNALHGVRSPRMLSFFLSLPLVLLSWSLVTFGFSVAFYSFHGSLPMFSYIATGSVLGLTVVFALATVLFFQGVFAHG